MVPKCTKVCKNTTVVSVEAFPELEQIVRHQLGLPPAAAGGNTGNIALTRLACALAFDDDKGQPAEGWMAAAIVVHTMPGGGRGAAYDWHAVNVLFFRTPKGQLDANDKLFKLIASTIHPEPEWQKWSNGVIASLYQKKQEELAKQSAMHRRVPAARRRRHQRRHGKFRWPAPTMLPLARISSSAACRPSATRRAARTFELSNQYDHAWLNGANEYVMSDDPNFNPNGKLNGNWNQLEVVRPQP